nr:CRISPR-associated protein Cas5 [Salinivibrio costicola]
MRDYLVFRLYGPLASWGEPAVGGDRPTSAYPSRSAVLGLLGAALGIKRMIRYSFQVCNKVYVSASNSVYRVRFCVTTIPRRCRVTIKSAYIARAKVN